MNIKKPDTKEIVLIPIFTALTALGAFLNIPTFSVPFSLQFIFCAYAGILLRPWPAFLSQLLYIVLGLIGIPVFTKGGGFNYIFQPTFGFILGFAACAFITGWLLKKFKSTTVISIFVSVLAGLSAMYIIGVPYLYFMYNLVAQHEPITFITAIKWGFTPFILFDMLKAVIVSVTGVKILTILKKV